MGNCYEEVCSAIDQKTLYIHQAQKKASMRLVGAYHGCPGSATEKYYVSEFPKRDSVVRCMICTVAFGMGIDIPDISHIFHFGISASVLSYWQEVGRAGREGQAASAYFFATAASKYHKPIPDKGMLSLVEKLSGDAECARVEVLQQLTVDGMDRSTMDSLKQRVPCAEDCTELCDCPLCNCCNLCERRCPCTQ